MAFMQIDVTKQTVTYADTFQYDFDISFDNLPAPLSAVSLEFVIPSFFEYTPIAAVAPIISVVSTPVADGTKINVNFGAITNSRMTASISLTCNYSLTAINGTDFTLYAALYTTTDRVIPALEANAPSVLLSIIPYYTAFTYLIVPNASSSAPGSCAVLEVVIENTGDQWPPAEEFIVSYDFNTPELAYFTLDTTNPIVGYDISGNQFADTSADGIEAVISGSGNGFTFTMPSYRGQKYHFYFKLLISSDALIGADYVITGYWQHGGTAGPDLLRTISMVAPNYGAVVGLSGPLKIQPNNYAKYVSSMNNSGNIDTTNVEYEFIITQNRMDMYRIQTGTFYLYGVNVLIDVEYTMTYVDYSGQEFPLGDASNPGGIYHTNVSSNITLADAIPIGTQVAAIRCYFPTFPVGALTQTQFQIFGFGMATLQYGQVINLHCSVTYDIGGGARDTYTTNFETTVSTLSELYVVNLTVSPYKNYVPEEILTFTSTINCNYSQLNNPIFVDFLSGKLTFQASAVLIDSFYFEYYNGQTGVTINSIANKAIFPFPTPEVVPNYNADGETLIRLTYYGTAAYSFPQNSWLKVQFSAKVKIGAIGSFTNQAILGNYGDLGAVSRSYDIIMEPPGQDIDGDNVYLEELAVSPPLSMVIVQYASMRVTKGSKGDADTVYKYYPQVASSYDAGLEYMLLDVENNGNASIQTMDLVDIIPYIGDTLVLYPNTPRNSQFHVYLLTALSIQFTDENGTPLTTYPTATIRFSRSQNPVRFGPTGGQIGVVNDWTTTIPSDYTEIAAFRVQTSGTGFLPTQHMKVRGTFGVPVDVTVGYLCWNSFALRGTYYNGTQLITMLPTETQNSGLQIIDTPDIPGITGFAWHDEDGDGYYQDGEEGVNDVGVILYKVVGSTAVAVDSKVTTTDAYGNKGRYRFRVQEPGQYLVRFAPDFYKYEFSPQHASATNGSKANTMNGFTPIMVITADTLITDAIVGLMKVQRMDNIIKVNKQAQKMMRNAIYSELMLTMKYESVKDYLQ